MTDSKKFALPFLLPILSLFLLLLSASAAHAQNTISTYAGGPPPSGVLPTAAPIEGPQSIVRDPAGNLYVVTDAGPIYKITPGTTAPGVLTIFAGNNTAGFSPDGTAAASTLTFEPYGAAVNANGDLYYSDSNNCVVREIVGGVVKTIAGTGACKYTGDNGPATSATLNFPQGIAFDGSGNLFIADAGNNVVRRVDANGTITTYAGNGTAGFSGDGGAATSAELNFPESAALDTAGNLFIADPGNNRIRRVDVGTKVITTIAGTGVQSYSGDGGPATAATLGQPDGVAVDTAGNIYIADTTNTVIREISSASSPAPGIITTIIGNNTFGFSGDGGPAFNAEITNPAGMFVDSVTGNVYFADYWANRIRLYNPANNKQISTVIGSGQVGDGAAATSASMYFPRTPGLDSQGNLFIVDAENNRIRKVSVADQTISTVVGTGIPCAQPKFTCGDGGPATAASLFMPRTVTIEANGTLLVSDDGDSKIRQVDGTSGVITTIVGSGNMCGTQPGQTPLPCGDGGPALSASLNDARGAIHDAAGNLYFVDAQDNRVREVDTTGTITTIAGGGTNNTAPTGCLNGSYTGDGGPAVSSTLDCPLGLDMDAAGNLYVADTDNNVIRKIDTSSPRIITTIVGNGNAGYTGDGGPATSATLNSPDRVSVNGAGNFFISDSGNQVIRRVDGATKNIATFAGNGKFAFAGDGGPALSASFATPVGVVVGPQGNLYVGDVNNNRVRKVVLNPDVTLSATTLPFTNQPINGNSMLPVTITNSGDAPLAISSITITSGAFTIATNPCPATLAVGANCVLEIQFAPTQFISYTGTVTITDNGPTTGSTQTVNLSGMGAASLTITATGTGTVTSSPAGINCPTTCTATFAGNSEVTLTAAPGAGQSFTGFGDNCAPATATTCTITMSANETVTAAFAATTSDTLTITKGGTGTGTVNSSPAGINCGATCSANFAGGTVITLTATPATGSTFTGWGAGPCEGTGTCTLTISAATSVVANFAASANSFTLTVTKAGTGTGTVTSAPAGINCGATCSASFASGTAITLTAAPATGSTFTGWSGAGCTGTSTCSVTLTAAQTVTATFTQSTNNFTLTVTKAGTGTGTVTSAPAGINCGATCSASFASGTAITLTAAPATGSTFTGWGAGPCEGTATCTLTIAAATTVVANFAASANNFTLTVAKAGTGTGTVTSAPAGINCGAACSATFASGTAVTLTATPATGSTFTGWGAPCEGTGTCSVTITAATTVTATFTQTTNNFTLTVVETGTGTGNVTSTPAGISCGAACSGSFASGTQITLTAQPAESSTFAGWSGAGCSGTSTCSVTLTAAQTVTATFNSSSNSPVTITVAPGSPSTVSTTPGGSAVFGLLLTATPGTTGTVTLGCTSPSPDITCQIVPGSVVLTGKGTNIAIVLNTFCTANVPGPMPLPAGGNFGGWTLLLAGLALCAATWKKKSQRRWALQFAIVLLAAATFSACASLPKSPGGQATPPGNYALTVTATAPNNSVSSVNLSLTVLP